MNPEKLNKICSIVVSSCDAFSDVWEAFFTLFFKYWPDCPFPIYLISETKKYADDRVKMINIGEDKKWATNLKNALKNIDTKNIIYLQEDYLLESEVDTERILKLLNILRENNAAYLKLFPSPVPKKKFGGYEDIGEIKKGDKYSISLQAAIWDKKISESLLVDGESGWDMEFKGSIRSVDAKEPFLSVYNNALDYFYATAIKKGVWYYDAVKLCEREGINIDKTKRKIETFGHFVLRKTKIIVVAQKIGRLIKRKKKYFLPVISFLKAIKRKYLQERDYYLFNRLNKEDRRFCLDRKDIYFIDGENTKETLFDAHYIYHPAWAARILAKIKPIEHVDISSTLHFCSIVSAFVPTKFYDYRPARLELSNLSTYKADLLSLPFEDNSLDSVSCMHVIEHIGLGRYGDPLDPTADLKAVEELKRVLAKDGNLLFVVPIGKPKIRFNAHRIYSYEQVLGYFKELKLIDFFLIPDNAARVGVIYNAKKGQADEQNYGCGCFWFKK